MFDSDLARALESPQADGRHEPYTLQSPYDEPNGAPPTDLW